MTLPPLPLCRDLHGCVCLKLSAWAHALVANPNINSFDHLDRGCHTSDLLVWNSGVSEQCYYRRHGNLLSLPDMHELLLITQELCRLVNETHWLMVPGFFL